MNKLKTVTLLLIIFLLLSCEKNSRIDKLEKKEINLSPKPTLPLFTPPKDTKKESIDTFLDIESLFPDKIAVKIKDSNLDLDPSIEQFIILVDKNNVITLVVADFNKISRDYFVAWEIDLPFIYNSDFIMTEDDVLGVQHNLELVLSGTTLNGNNALYLFKKTAPPRGINIYYKTIFSYESTGTVELVSKTRDLDYTEKRKSQDKAYDIVVVKTDMLNENTLAIITENWVWDRRRDYFIKENSNIEETKINVKEKLTAIIRGNKSDFKEFLNGEWYHINNDEKVSNIIIIDHNNDTVMFKYIKGVEIYEITRTRKIYQLLKLYLRNKDVPTIPRNISFTLNSTDEMTVSVGDDSYWTDDSYWNGDYVRLKNDVKTKLISNTNTEIGIEPEFTGLFKNVSYSLNFSYPNYQKIDPIDGTIKDGHFSIIRLSNGLEILQLREKGEHRAEYKETNYKLEYTQQDLDSQIIRTIKISEGTLTTYGIEINPDISTIKLEQTEVLSSEQ